jgi:Ca2+-binding EF-hand superfamily protein
MPRTFHRNRNAEPEKKEESKDEKSRTFRKQIVRQEGNSSELIHKRNKSNLSPSKMKEEIKISKKEIKEEKVIENKTENENKIKIQNFKVKVKRPNFTEDEILQIKNDFNLFDSQSSGLIKPNIILLIANRNKDWGNKNPFYYTALKELKTEENNLNGINVDQFVNAVKRVIREYDVEDFDNNWSEIYNLYFVEGKKKNVIDNEILIKVIKDLGFKISDDEINEFVDRMEGEIDLNKFIEIMKEVELSNFRQ